MTNHEKAAVLLLSLEEELAARVLKNLMPEEIKILGVHMNRLSNISNDDMAHVAQEFCQLAKEKGKRIMSVKDDVIKGILVKAMGEEKAKKIMESIEEESLKPYANPVIERLRNVDSRMIMDFTKMEHPQTIALILAHLRSEQAAEVLENLPSEKQVEILRRMATLKSVPHEFIDEMTRALESELVVSGTSEQNFGGIGMAAEILNKMSRSTENTVLEAFDDTNPELAVEIRNLMFTFDDIFDLDDRSIRDLLQEVSSEDLARALKVADQDMREKILKNMSKRAAEMLMEDIDLMPPTRLSEVEQSQRNIVETTKRLEAEGRIQLSRDTDDDQFV